MHCDKTEINTIEGDGIKQTSVITNSKIEKKLFLSIQVIRDEGLQKIFLNVLSFECSERTCDEDLPG